MSSTHGVRITDSAIVAAATLSHRYITDRFLPDKAIDLIDEAAARLKMQVDSNARGPRFDRSRDRAAQDRAGGPQERVRSGLEGEAQAAQRRAGRAEKRSADLPSRWKSEKEKLSRAQKLKAELDQLRTELANAQRRGEYQRAGELAYGRIPELEKRLKAVEAAEGQGAVLEEAVTADHVAQVVSRWTGVPVRPDAGGARGKSSSPWRRSWQAASSARRRR